MFEDEELKDINSITRMVAEQGMEETRAALERIRERNRQNNLERYGCNCPAAKCFASCPKHLTHDKHADLLDFLARTSPPDRSIKDYIQPMPAPPAKAGGSKSGRRNKKQPTLKRLYIEC